jgi:hypothetical protein
VDVDDVEAADRDALEENAWRCPPNWLLRMSSIIRRIASGSYLSRLRSPCVSPKMPMADELFLLPLVRLT